MARTPPDAGMCFCCTWNHEAVNAKVLEPCAPSKGTIKFRTRLKRVMVVVVAVFLRPQSGATQRSSEGDKGLTGRDMALFPAAEGEAAAEGDKPAAEGDKKEGDDKKPAEEKK